MPIVELAISNPPFAMSQDAIPTPQEAISRKRLPSDFLLDKENTLRPVTQLAQKPEVRQYATFLVIHALVYGIGFTIALLP
ncbi:hypothetical protein Pan97_05400 [Bremerella volcania]|uniref:Uncharacterized protein n=1 Tax=Bremerella volcania TaxID=2527984 RepID=A0A518C309_9BACT|nr:hypothetical protein [Bremerella volcania]QDU73564.1 hypothetical protein Pan97_05400 [Bremerella volcania]